MNTWIKATASVFAAAAFAAAAFAVVAIALSVPMTDAQAADPTSLRGQTALDKEAAAPDIHKQATGELFGRAYRQQPPLIPHDIDAYQIDVKANQCIGCHDWPQNTVAGAPKISETHYIGRAGERLNHVSTARWFCTQCHVPQAQVEALVPNEFKSAAEMY